MEEEKYTVQTPHIYESYRDPDEGLSSVSEAINVAMTELQEAQCYDGIPGIPSGFESIDRLTFGWREGEFIVIAGRTSSGKTTLALNMAQNAAVDHNIHTLYITFSESSRVIARRLALSSTDLYWDYICGVNKLEDYHWEHLEYRLKALSKSPLYINDSPRLSTDDIGALIQKMTRERGIRLVFIDDFNSITTPIDYRGNKEAEMSNISIELKRIAREQNVAIIALARLSRSAFYDNNRNSSSKPRLSDLKDTSALENDADKILFVHKEDFVGLSENPDDYNKVSIIIAKNRNGETCDIDMYYKREEGKFKELDETLEMGANSMTIDSQMNVMLENDPNKGFRN